MDVAHRSIGAQFAFALGVGLLAGGSWLAAVYFGINRISRFDSEVFAFFLVCPPLAAIVLHFALSRLGFAGHLLAISSLVGVSFSLVQSHPPASTIGLGALYLAATLLPVYAAWYAVRMLVPERSIVMRTLVAGLAVAITGFVFVLAAEFDRPFPRSWWELRELAALALTAAPLGLIAALVGAPARRPESLSS